MDPHQSTGSSRLKDPPRQREGVPGRDETRLSDLELDALDKGQKPHCVSNQKYKMTDDELALRVRNLFGLEFREYFLFCGALEPKKNVSRLVNAYAASGSKHRLVIGGPLGTM
jgi:hypothetical protein